MAYRVDERPEHLTFRKMRLGDVPQVLANERSSYDFPWSRGIFEDCLQARYQCWILERGRDVIGHGVLSLVAGEAHLLNVCIAQREQGRGHGRQLVLHLLDRARAAADLVFLEVRPSNAVAVALYRSLGFNEVGLRKNYYPMRHGREDALVLALQFDPA